MDAELARLSVVLDARLDKFEAQMNKAVRSSHAASGRIEKAFSKDVGKGLRAQLEGATKSALGASGGLMTLGPAGAAAAIGIGSLTLALTQMRTALQFADDLAAMAAKIGVTAEQLQELRFAAAETDVPVGDLESGLQKLNAALGALKLGKGDAKIKAFAEELGIDKASLRDVNDASDLLPLLADRLSQVKTRAEQVRIAKALGIEELLPLLRKGSAGLAEMTDRARSLGLVMSDELTAEAADANRQLEILQDMVGTRLTIAFAKLSSGILGTGDDLDGLAEKFDAMVIKARDALLQVAGFWQGIREKATPPPGADWIPGSNLVADFARGQEDRFRGIADMWASDRGPGRTGGSGTPQGGGFAGGYTPPRTRFRGVDGDGRGGSGATGAAKKQAADDLERLLKAHADDIVQNGSKSFQLYVKQFQADVADFDGNPDLRDGPPTDLVGRGMWLMTPEEAAELERNVSDIAYGALDALAKGGTEGLWAYAGEQLSRSLMDGASDALARLAIQFLQSMAAGGGPGGQGGWASGLANFAISAFSPPAYADGTNFHLGGMAWVGERGKELVNMPRGSQVIPNHRLEGLGRPAAAPVHQHFHMHAEGAVMTDQLMASLNVQANAIAAQQVARGLSAANRTETARQAAAARLGARPLR